MNSLISTILGVLICLLPFGIGLIVVLLIRGKPLSMRGVQSAIQMDGATFLKMKEGDITIKRRTLYTWLLIGFFGAVELGILVLTVSMVSDLIKGKDTLQDVGIISFVDLLIAVVLFQNIRSLRQPSVIHFNTNSRIVEIQHGAAKQQILFSQISKISAFTRPTLINKVARINIQLNLNDGKVIELGSVTDINALSRVQTIAQQIAELTGAAMLGS